MLKLQSDLIISFEQLITRFEAMLDGYKEELEKYAQEAMNNFDFETAIKKHIEVKIQLGLRKAFKDIDLSEKLKSMVWNEINKKLGEKE